MALINLQTNLKNLRWGSDQPDGGDSGLPYIKTPLPENASAMERIVLESAKYSSDFPQRGGLYAVRAAAEDAIRIRKFLTDFPKGSNFTMKQVGLQKSNPLIETGVNGGRINTRTYNLNTNLLLSTLLAGTGDYIPRAGATPFTLTEDNNKYLSIVGKKSVDDNRLFNLYKSKILEDNVESSKLLKLGISSDEFTIMQYLGGPGSLYGDGETNIFRSTDHTGNIIKTNNIPENVIKLNSPYTTKLLGASKFLNILDPTLTIDELNSKQGLYDTEDGTRNEISDVFRENVVLKTSPNTLPYNKIISKERYIIGSPLIDFRSEIEPSGSVFSRNYSDPLIFRERRIGLGSPGSRPRELRTNTNQIYEPGQDKINMTPIYYGPFSKNVENDPNTRDLIKFAFEVIDNNSPNNTYRTHFRAFMKGFTDNNSAEWNSKRYTGRGDQMYNYQGFDRNISFNFVVMAQSKQEMKPLWQKLNFLNSSLQPDYDNGTGFMRGNIHRLTVGEYLYRVPGIITSLNFSIDDNYSWEIKIDEPEGGRDNDMMELPHAINVSVSFKPIFNELPRTVTLDNYNNSALISKEIGDIENFIRNKNPFQIL